ncbi:MAG: peptide ABC transporter substrate-binding protein [Oscillospiraceae bacterium]|nr:peptide ABC transporter substrate-binding protein [Oscillospiraceae bacterium]
MKKAIIALICLILAVLPLSGCRHSLNSSGSQSGVRYDVFETAENLDPQFATGITERLVIGNIFEGLLSRDENGELTEGAAERYEISPDGLILTFRIRSDAKWSNGKPVTPDDFVFAFRRMFDPGMPSPFAMEYSAIENAVKILNGEAQPSSLGVIGKSGGELEIRLSRASPYFPESLAETPAMPCNEEFFIESRGRYGLEKRLVNSNGPYSLDRWDNESAVTLRPNQNYNGEAKAALNVSLTFGNMNEKLLRFTDGLTDIIELTDEEASPFIEKGYTAKAFDGRVWCVVFNTDSAVWGNPLLRQALALTADRESLSEILSPEYTITEFAVPAAATIAYKPYREHVRASPVPFDPEQGKRLFEMGVHALGMDGAVSDVIHVPEKPENTLAMNIFQQSWQRSLSTYISVESEPFDAVYLRLLEKDYSMAFFPLASPMPKAVSFLSAFSGKNGFPSYESPLFEAAVNEISGAMSMDEAAAHAARAESLLLQDAVVIPVFLEKTYVVISPDINGLSASGFPSQLRFWHAKI